MFPTDNMGGSLPVPGGVASSAGGGFPVEPPAEPDPQAQATSLYVAQIIQATRRLAMMYPAANPELRQITGLMEQVQQKIVGSRPSPEPAAPPM